ncbi:hypothetical protein Tco_0765432 [Tanacetum coccineum]
MIMIKMMMNELNLTIHPKLSTHDDEARKDDEVNEEESNEESNDESNEESDEEVQGANTKEEEMDEEATHEEDEANELYRDVNVNLEGRDTVMTDAPLPNSSSVSSGFVSNMLNPRPDTSIDLIFNTEGTSLVDVSVITIAEPPLVFATTLPPPPTYLIIHMQQTPFPIPTTSPRTSLQDLSNFGSLSGFDHRLKTLETDFFEFKQTNQFAEAISSIPAIVDAYLANKMHEVVKTAVQLQSNKLRDEAQAENEDFLNKLDDNIKKIIKDQVKQQVKAQVSKIFPRIEKTVNEQLEAEVMTRSSTESKTSLAIAANLSELELKKILIEKICYVIQFSFKKDAEDDVVVEEPSLDQTEGPGEDELEKNQSQPVLQKETTSKTTGKSNEGSKSQHEYARDVYSRRRIIDITKLQIVEWHGYKHLDWIIVRRDDDKLHTFKEGDFKRLRL